MSAEYMSGPHDGPKCACRHDGLYWQKRCAAAAANDRKESARWAADHVRRNYDMQYTVEYLRLAEEGGLKSIRNEDLR